MNGSQAQCQLDLPYAALETTGHRMGFGELRSVRPLGTGAANESFRIEFSRWTLVYKRALDGHNPRLRQEFDLLHHPRNVWGPRAWSHFETPDGLLEDLVPGKHLFVLTTQQAFALGRHLHRLHTADASGLPHLDAPGCKAYLAHRLLPQWEELWPLAPLEVLRRVERALLTFEAEAPYWDECSSERSHVLVHTDLIPLNILFQNSDRCSFLDWEWARMDVPEWDLASLLKAFRFEPSALAAFWEGYALPFDPGRLRAVSAMHCCNVALWRLRCLHVRHEHQDSPLFRKELEEELGWLDRNLELRRL